ncbi:MAG: outer membrane beta-barrel protein [Flavobacteriales bacterium]
MSHRIHAILALVLFLPGSQFLLAQKERVGNLKNFDKKPYHFGFILAYNTSNFYLDTYNAFPTSDSLMWIGAERQPGFDLGPLASLNLSKNISLRFIPAISFQDRRLRYGFYRTTNGKLQNDEVIRRVESTYINLPFNLKLRTDRVNNFAAYAVVGYQYSIDMASQKDVVNTFGREAIVRIRRPDHAWQVGGGLDFFLPYFKFGLELKVSSGLKNLLLQDNNMYTSPIDRLRSKVVLFSFTFEG